MKKIRLIGFLALLAVVGGLWYAAHRHSNVAVSTPQAGGTAALGGPDASNATFTFDDGPVTLHGGAAMIPATDDSATESDINLISGMTASGDLNADGKADTAVLLLDQGGGSGVFVYVGAYVSGNVSYKGTNALFIGDRIQPTSVSIKSGKVVVNYLDRTPDEPMTDDPTVPTSKTFVFKNGELVEN